jgi:hypothetical protein
MIFYLLYWGIESTKLSHADIELILTQARENNSNLGITGALIYCHGTFIQLLEGSEKTVKELFVSISKDSRLAAVKLVTEGEVEKRYFQDWSMMYEKIDSSVIAEFEKYPVSEVQDYIKNAPALKLLQLMTRKRIKR